MSSIKNDFKRNQKPELTGLVYGKVPPQASDIEDALLGAIMLEKDVLDMVIDMIPSADIFYKFQSHQIYDAILELYRNNRPVDGFTVIDQLTKSGQIESIGGSSYVLGISNSISSTAHAQGHALILLEKYMLRESIRICGSAINEAYNEETDPFELLDKAENELSKVANMFIKKPVLKVTDAVSKVMQRIDELRSKQVDMTGVATGFSKLNELIGGWQNKDLYVIGARPSVGKTAFVLNTAIACAMDSEYGGPCAVFNLEMGSDQLTERMLSATAGVKLHHIRRPMKLEEVELTRLAHAAPILANRNIYIDDTPGLGLSELRSKARKLKKEKDIKLVIIDYLQLMEVETERGVTREQQLAKISRGLKKLAKELDIPVIALSQLAREVEKLKRIPMLSDLRESGAIEQDADMVMFLYKPTEQELKEEPLLRGKVMGTIAKSRHGETKAIIFNARNAYQRWADIDSDIWVPPGQISPTFADSNDNTIKFTDHNDPNNSNEDLPF